MASAAPIVNDAPPMVEVKNIFFKAHPPIDYFANEAEADAIDNEIAFQNFNRSLECSNKHGCVLLTFNNVFYLLRVSDVLAAQNQSRTDKVTFNDLKKLEIKNDALPVTPNIIALSAGEDFLAVDTVRGDSAWTVIFQFSDFINQGGSCRPFCEVRCSSTANSKVSSINWNPGDGFTDLVAVNTEDGSLFLAKIVGSNNMELNRFADGGVRCCCWSPKGKQLVVGRANGNLSQLRLDLTEAKQIPGPKPEFVPVSILWTQTTQFLVVFRKESYIDFMQLDVPKGIPPTYTNAGDIFISEIVPTKCSCYFIPLTQWNVVLATTNSGSDVMVLVKEQQNSNELWVPGDITDSRRAAFLLDNFARGASIYYACGGQVTFSDVESYAPMPMVFLLSQRGSLLIFSIVNSDPQAIPLNVNVVAPLPDTLFLSNRQPLLTQSSVAPIAPSQIPQQIGANNVPFSQTLQQPSPSLFTVPAGAQAPILQIPTPTVPLQQNRPLESAPLPLSVEPSQKAKSIFGVPVAQTLDTRQLGTSTLPTAQDMAGLQKAVEEKRREMTTQLQKGVSLKGLEDDDQCAFVISEVRKFEQRLAEFKSNVDSHRGNLTRLVNTSFDILEKRVLSTLNVVEDFSSDMVCTTSAQKEEVAVLKERILNHFSQLEYAKSLVERSRDPRYLEHLRSRPLDPASQQKFEEIKKLHNYLQTQVAECRRYFYEQGRKRDMPIDRVSYTQLIYLTLSNHSKIIRRLKSELDSIKERLGLGRHNSCYDDAEYLAVCEASYSAGTKKSAASVSNDDPDEITLNDLTAGISKVKLNRESDRPDKKPVKLANRKLFILKKCMPEVTVIKVKADETSWSRSPSKTASRPKTTAYPTAAIDGAISRVTDFKEEPDTQNKSTLPSNTFTIKSETPLHTNTPQQFVSNTPAPFMGMSSNSPTIDFSSMMKSSMSNVATSSNLNKQTSTPPTATSKSTEMSFVSNQQPPSSASPVSILKSSIQMTSNTASVSPSTQLPTLAGLLATPVSSVPSNLFPTFTSTAANNAAKPDKGLSFGTGQFSFATQQVGSPSNKSTSSTTASPSTSFTFQQTGGTSLPTMPINFGTAPLSSTVSTSSITSSSITSSTTGIFASAAGFTNKSTTAVPSTQLFSSGNLTAVPKQTAEAVTGVPSSPSPSDAKTASTPTMPINFGTTPLPNTVSSSSITSSSLTSSTTGIFGSGFPNKSTTAVPTTQLFGSGNLTTVTAVPKQSAEAVTGLTSSPSPSDAKTASTPSMPINFGTTPLPSTVSSSSIITSSLTSSAATGIFASGGAANISTTTVPTTQLFSSGNFATVTAVTKPSSVGLTPASEPSVGSKTATSEGIGSIGTNNTSSGGGLFSSGPVASPTSGNISSVSNPNEAQSTLITTPAVSSVDASITSVAANLPAGLQITSISGATPAAASTKPPLSSNNSVEAASVFGGVGSVFGTTTAAGGGAFSTTGTGGVTQQGFGFGQAKPSTAAPGFGSPPAAAASVFGGNTAFDLTSSFGSTFVSPPTAAKPTSIFGGGSVFSTTSAGGVGGSVFSTTSAGGVGGSLFSTTSAGGGGGSVFSTTSAGGGGGSVFSTTTAAGGGGSVFSATSAGAGGAFSAGTGAVAQQGFGFAQAKPSTGAGFASPPAAAPVFGGGATFGSTSPFGSSFASSPKSAESSSIFGGGGSVFSTTTAGAGGAFSAGTGAVAQQGFGFAQAKPATGTGFASPPTAASVFGGGATFGLTSSFGSTFASAPTSVGSTSVFGGGGSVFSTTTAGGGGAFSAGTGGVTQQGFGFSQAKPATATGFGNPPAAAPVFGGGATFGSTSPFGSSFAASPTSTFGTAGGNVFGGGGGGNVQNAGFGSLAQQGAASPGFGSGGTGGFGGAQPQPSLFGSPQQQQPQQAKPVFGGQAFSSWR